MGGPEKDAKRTVKQAKGTSSKFAGNENIGRQEEDKGFGASKAKRLTRELLK